MNIDATGQNESPDEGKDVERESSFPIRPLKVDAANEIVPAGVGSGLQGTSSLQVQQLPPQATVVCWARFLHVESIRVLLVENDDCTRHVVTALLRNCNYEVVDAANGVQAWKILEDLNNRIDLVLTEVVMPFLPGIPLLSKIMSHKTRKNIPVIMMSSHDSMGLVFKCLSKGAVDFLVKPIRKNELKNLWQHVWRRCHSSSGSGSESGTHTQKSVNSKNSEKSDNCGSDDGENEMSNGLNVGDGSDDGSGTQSSWTKQVVEVDSSPALSPIDQVAERQDSTCAQVIRSNAENSVHKRVHITVARGVHEQRPEGEDLEGIIPNNMEHRSKNSMENSVPDGSKVNPLLEFECMAVVKQSNAGQDKPAAECSFRKHKVVADEAAIPNTDGRESKSTREVTKMLDNCNKEPNLELSLKRFRGVQDSERSTQEERFVLRRSEQSAFSRYNTLSNTFKPPNGITGSSSMFDNCTEASKLESVRNIQAYSADHHVYLSSNGVISNKNIDMGSTTNKLPKLPTSVKDESETTSTINGLHSSAFQPVKNYLRYGPQQVGMQNTDLTPARLSHSHHHNFHHNHHSNNFHKLEQQPSSNLDESSSKKLAMDTQIGEAKECNLNDNSLNRSVSGSNHVSNVRNGVNTVGCNGESDGGQAGKSGSGDASGSGSGSGSGNKIDEDKIALRIAALSKFRQKKKDRCFTKKIRYHNRKKLAEQRPRVRGQFVKQNGTDSSNRNSDE